MMPMALCLAALAPDDELVRHKLEEIARRAEFHDSPEMQWDFSWLAKFFEWLGGLHSAAPVLWWALVITCVALLVLFLVHLVWIVWRIHRPRRDSTGLSAADRRRLSAEFLAAADRAASARSYTEAVRHLFLALVYHFDESGRLHFQPANTNHEYLRHFAKKPELLAPLRVFVETLDDHWYGMHDLHESSYRTCRELFDQLWRGA